MYKQTQFKVLSNSVQQPEVFALVGNPFHSEEAAQADLKDRTSRFTKWIDREINNSATEDDANFGRNVKSTIQFKIQEEEIDYGFASQHLYSDVEAWEIVKVVSEKCIEVRRMDTEHSIDHLEQIPGGFAGHVVNQQDQKVTYTSNPENAVIRIRRRKGSETQWGYKGARFTLREQPYAFYDYNF